MKIFSDGLYPVAFRTFAVDPPHAVPTMLKRLNAAKVEQAQQVVAGYAQDWPENAAPALSRASILPLRFVASSSNRRDHEG